MRICKKQEYIKIRKDPLFLSKNFYIFEISLYAHIVIYTSKATLCKFTHKNVCEAILQKHQLVGTYVQQIK